VTVTAPAPASVSGPPSARQSDAPSAGARRSNVIPAVSSVTPAACASVRVPYPLPASASRAPGAKVAAPWTVPVPPNAAPAAAESEGLAWVALLISSVPALTVVAPVNVLVAVRISVPRSVFSNGPSPPIRQATVAVAPLAISKRPPG